MALGVDIRQGEERTAVYAAFFALLGMTAAHTLIETARDALFLAKIPASRLVWVYAMFAAIAVVIARLRERRATASSGGVAPGLIIGAVVTLAFWGALHLSAAWLLYVLYLWPGIFGAWIIGALWTTVGSAFTVTQAKRLFGFIGAGAVLGALAGAGLSRLPAGMFAPQHLRRRGVFVSHHRARTSALARSRYAGVRYPGAPASPEGACATFRQGPRGDFYGCIHDAGLGAHGLVHNRVHGDRLLVQECRCRAHPVSAARQLLRGCGAGAERAGLGRADLRRAFAGAALGSKPGARRDAAIAGASAVGVAILPALATVLLVRGIDGTTRYSLHKTTTEILFVPLPAGRAKSLIDLLGVRGGLSGSEREAAVCPRG